MAQEKILAKFDSPFIQMKTGAISQQEAVSTRASDPETYRVAQNRAERGSAHHKPDVQVVAPTGVDCRCYQDCLTWERQSDGFQPNDQSYHPIAIGGDEMD
jgi:hypothetical protein